MNLLEIDIVPQKQIISKEKRNQYQRAYILKNKEKYTEYKRNLNKQYRENDIEKVRELMRKGQNKYQAKVRMYKQEASRLRSINLF